MKWRKNDERKSVGLIGLLGLLSVSGTKHSRWGSFFFRLAGYMSPFVILLGSVPVYTTGKVQRIIMVLEF